MDSLLANYASSDEENHEEQPKPVEIKPNKSQELFPPKSTPNRVGTLNSLPPPKSSFFNSLPPPKYQSVNPNPNPKKQRDDFENSKPKSLFSSIPQPKSSSSSLFSSVPQPKSSFSKSASKKVVQFRPLTVVNTYVDDEDDDDDEAEKERQRKKAKESISTASASSFLSSIPAPKYSGTLGAGFGTGRKSMLETDTPASTLSTASAIKSDAVVSSDVGYSKDHSTEMNYDYSGDMNSNVGYSGDQSNGIYDHPSSFNGGEGYAYYGGYGVDSGDASGVSNSGVNSNAGSVEAVDYYGDHDINAQYENNWASSANVLPGVSVVAGNALQVPGKRGRKDIPPEIIEVSQDELMKNRPREDQAKSTGIAFGPAYQPASTKGKPSKLHKRKHQISSLYFDMRQKETELAERRSKGYLTKAQTQGKYGW